MEIQARMTGRWIDVDTYVTVGNTGKVTSSIDAGLFEVIDFFPIGELSYLENIDFQHAIVDFGELVNQGLKLGDEITFTGTIEGDYVTSRDNLDQHRKLIKNATLKLASVINTWGKHNLKGNQLIAYDELTDRLVKGELYLSSWRASLQLLLFGDREPSQKFLKFQTKIQPLEQDLVSSVAQAAEYTLIFSKVVSSAYQTTTPASKITDPNDVPIYREVLIAGVPMRENYKQEWHKYREEAKAYHQQQAKQKD
ncbi:hypothetical protein [Lacticaseibacillus sp. GG6-2]